MVGMTFLRLPGAALLLATALSGCVVNPVTGESELSLISPAQEVALGEEQYLPTRQIQGGDYTADPELVRYVRSVGHKLAEASERPGLPYEFTVIDNGTPNAWALPGGKIAINRGLLTELDSEAELAAVLGHEIVHAAARHGAQSISRGLLLQAGALLIADQARDSEYAGLIAGGALLGAQLINQRYSREAELEADRHGMRYMQAAGYNPAAAVELQRTFVRLAEQAGRESGWLEGLFASHPPSAARVAANLETARELGMEGRLGRETYRAMTARLRAAQPAYAAFEKARAAFRDNRLEAAARLTREALAIEPRAAKFHALLGEIALRRDRPAEALEHFAAALAHNPRYFEFHLGRGRALLALQRRGPARQAFEQANALLPTAFAHEALGDIALAEGRRAEAVAHYRVAAGSDSPAGRRAREKLAQLGETGT